MSTEGADPLDWLPARWSGRTVPLRRVAFEALRLGACPEGPDTGEEVLALLRSLRRLITGPEAVAALLLRDEDEEGARFCFARYHPDVAIGDGEMEGRLVTPLGVNRLRRRAQRERARLGPGAQVWGGPWVVFSPGDAAAFQAAVHPLRPALHDLFLLAWQEVAPLGLRPGVERQAAQRRARARAIPLFDNGRLLGM
jgi:hypothetical protein